MRLTAWAMLFILGANAGCQSGMSVEALNPFASRDRVSIATPTERADSIRALAEQSTGTDTPEQQAIVADLVAQLRDEHDPLIRETMLVTLSEFNTPLAAEAVLAGLSDTDPFVRRTCCRVLGENPSEEGAIKLTSVLREDSDFDVRVAAARALGAAPGGQQVLVAALEDRDPAMQYVGVTAMKELTGKDLGGDVSAYIALAKGETHAPSVQEEPQVNVANRLTGWIPFF